jgi:hypothetical protein
VAKWRGGEVAKWRGGEVAKWRGGEVARWRGGEVAKWRDATAMEVIAEKIWKQSADTAVNSIIRPLTFILATVRPLTLSPQ